MHMQSIPRTVLLDTKTGSNLLQWPVVETLRIRSKSFDGVAVEQSFEVPLDVDGKASQLDIEAVFHVDPSAAVEGVMEAGVEYKCSTSGCAGPSGPVRAARVWLT
jgi:beta-fructofuranosidase